MQFMRDLMLRKKLMLIMMLSSCLTLAVACASWFYVDLRASRSAQVRELSLLAEVVGGSVAAGVDFGTKEEIESDLLLLALRPSICRAAVFDVRGQALASYSTTSSSHLLPYDEKSVELDGEHLLVYSPIHWKGERIGTIGIESDLTEIGARQLGFFRTVLLVLLGCLLLALGLSYRLQGFISEPVLRLARMAREVSQRKDYSLRAERLGRDELGELTDSINTMLAAIQERDARLQESRSTLEVQVGLRTQELTEKNARLQISMEEAREAAVVKAQFLANMSHEIRTPMNGILGMNELLLESSLGEEQKSYAEIVKSSAESLLEIINDILDFSKIEAGKMKLENIEFDLFRMVEEVTLLLSGSARKKGLELSCWLEPGLPRSLRGDPTRLRQVLTNLIGNAIKFTTQGQVQVRVEQLEVSASSARVRFVIQDTGTGIAKDRQAKLFQPFTQGDASTTRRFGGTGLGLAISRQLVELMGGELGVNSELGVGSTFWCTARLERPAGGGVRNLFVPEGCTRPRVLVAEGSAATREMLHQQMTAWGFEHEVAADPARALSLLRRGFASGKPLGLILLDDTLADEELATFLARERPPLRPKIVLLSWTHAAPGSSALGAHEAALRKPVRPSELFDVLMNVLGANEVLRQDLAVLLCAHGDAAAPPTRPLRVLLAEDNPINRLVAIKILAKDGHQCEVVVDGRAAVEAVQREHFDVVLMDCQMPELDGFEATSEIRAFERLSQRPRTHVIALTANAMKGDRERCLELGMDDYLSKPVKPDLLLAKLRHLGQTRATRAAAAPLLDVEGLVRRFTGRPGDLRLELAGLECRSQELLRELADCVRGSDRVASQPHLEELRTVLSLLASPSLAHLADELEAAFGAARPEHTASALAALDEELRRCLELTPAAVARVEAA